MKEICLAGEPCVLSAAGTLWLKAHQTLVVSDLHLEKGSAYAAKGQLLPPYDTRETLNRLQRELEATRPARLVLLGDSLHDMQAVNRIGAFEAEALRTLAARYELVWITGNHDPDGGAVFGGVTAQTLQLGALTLRHEPMDYPVVGEVAGHLHPSARFAGAAGSVRRPSFITDNKRLIMPAFGAYTGGLNVRDRAFAPLFAGDVCVFMTGRSLTPLAYSSLLEEGRRRGSAR